jgi:hypothetical protein
MSKIWRCQCDDVIPGSFARVVGNLGTSLSSRQIALIVRIFAIVMYLMLELCIELVPGLNMGNKARSHLFWRPFLN